MAKAYWVVQYHSISNPDALAAYAKLAAPAVQAAGGHFVVRGMPVKTYEGGRNQRMVVVEYPNLSAALAAHDSDGYQAALQALGNGAVRDMRVLEGVGDEGASRTGLPKGYMTVQYHAVRDAAALAAYAKIAGPAMAAGGGRFLVRGEPATVWEAGKLLRTVVVEFDSTAKCIAAYDGPAYAEALRALGNAADRDMRVLEGVA